MSNAKAVDLLVRHMEEKCATKSRALESAPGGPVAATPHEPDSRVASFALSYLDAFGYLKRELAEWKDITLPDILDGLVHFQEMFQLPKTKALTVQTVKAMEARRCGCCDLLTPCCASGQRAITERLPKWKKAGLTYFVEDGVPGLDREVFNAALRSGFLAWTIYVNLHVEPAPTPGAADIVVGVGKGPQSNFDGPGGTFAWTELPDGSDKPVRMKFDGDEQWTADARQPGVCVHNVVRHEIGHALGLTHSRVPTALMAPAYNPVVRDPQQVDDVSRLLDRYGIEAPPGDDRATVEMPVPIGDAIAALKRAGYKVTSG
jgi:hypothetical protein